MVQLKNFSKNRRRISVLLFGMTAFMAITFNFTSIFKFQDDSLFALYLPEDFTEFAVTSSINHTEGVKQEQRAAAAIDVPVTAVQAEAPARVLLGGGGGDAHSNHSSIQRLTEPVDLVKSSRNTSSVVPIPLSKEPASPLSNSRSRVPSSSRSRSKNATDTDVALVTVTDVVDPVMDTINSRNSLCGGCFLAIINPWTTCGDRIESSISQARKNHKKNKSIPTLNLVQAAKKVAVEYPETCSRCDPTACPFSEKQYWREVLSSATKTNTISTPTDPIQDSLCGGCRLAVFKQKNPYTTCGDRINSVMSQSQKSSSTTNLTLVQAAVQVAAAYPELCSRCDPTACPASEKLYWRFDQMAPVINYGRTHMLSSIPATNRIPASAMADLPSYFSNPANVMGPDKKYLYEYNPSIALLPPDQIPASLVVAAADNSYNKAVYLATYRVTDINLCMPEGGKQLPNPRSVRIKNEENVGIAFLRADLTIIRDFTVDMHAHGFRWQDFRLVNLAGKLYISGKDFIAPVWLNVPTDIADIARKDNKYMRVLHDMFQKAEDRTGNDLTLSVRTYPSCCSTCKGKNFNYFMGVGSGESSSSTSHNNTSATKILVETNPIFPHTVDEVDLSRRCREVKKERKDNSVSTSKAPALSHYSNMEQILFESGHNNIQQSADRGTAGFVKLQVPDEGNNNNNSTGNNKTTAGQTSKSKQLLVGISHKKIYRFGDWKVKYRHSTYTSNFYAFEQTPPYRVVARSGAFCLGFPSEEENEQNHYSQLVRSRPFILGKPQNCPQITFISGMTEKAGDDSKVIVGYGINDCVPRFVEIDKSEIARLLFSPTLGRNSSYAIL